MRRSIQDRSFTEKKCFQKGFLKVKSKLKYIKIKKMKRRNTEMEISANV